MTCVWLFPGIKNHGFHQKIPKDGFVPRLLLFAWRSKFRLLKFILQRQETSICSTRERHDDPIVAAAGLCLSAAYTNFPKSGVAHTRMLQNLRSRKKLTPAARPAGDAPAKLISTQKSLHRKKM
jgi:hypothetical protein